MATTLTGRTVGSVPSPCGWSVRAVTSRTERFGPALLTYW